MSQAVPRRWVIASLPMAMSAFSALSISAAAEEGRIWATRGYIHYDRTASPWLIKRFIDPQAQFVFVPPGEEERAPPQAIRFGMPGVELSSYDQAGSTFQKLINKYGINDPAVAAIARMIAAGADYLIKGVRPATEDKYGQMAFGLLALANGVLLTQPSDEDSLALWMRNYDALYATLRAEMLLQERGLSAPAGRDPRARILFLRDLLRKAAVPVPLPPA